MQDRDGRSPEESQPLAEVAVLTPVRITGIGTATSALTLRECICILFSPENNHQSLISSKDGMTSPL